MSSAVLYIRVGTDDRKGKNAIVTLVHHSDEELKTNLSVFITLHMHQDYNYLSNLFSQVEGITIEKYFILQCT
jgi:ACT domain-containing protein